LVKLHPTVIWPFYLGGIGVVINGILRAIPFVDKLAITTTAVIRPVIAQTDIPSTSILIPARNEKGNIENALKRIPEYFAPQLTEIIFVEGHSTDGTFEEIQRVAKLYSHRFSDIKVLKQTGKGKVDAVRTGFAVATMDLLVILDADLTMPPELLPRFVEAYRKGLGDFINGDRLVYKMEGKAMKFLNRLGNIFFAKALSFILSLQLGDVLCGTKVFSRHDYQRFVCWRKQFGDFDPFGDFELLFPASQLGLSVINLPIKYLDRTYGDTNIHRFRDGFRLLKMTIVGLVRIKAGL
jgi:glycosyltransferase involved in cell wall biosynthesis